MSMYENRHTWWYLPSTSTSTFPWILHWSIVFCERMSTTPSHPHTVSMKWLSKIAKDPHRLHHPHPLAGVLSPMCGANINTLCRLTLNPWCPLPHFQPNVLAGVISRKPQGLVSTKVGHIQPLLGDFEHLRQELPCHFDGSFLRQWQRK